MNRPTALDRLVEFALSLPGTSEADHHGISSLRVREKIFATVPDADHLRIMASEPEILAAHDADPAAYGLFYWGRRLACVVVDTRRAEATRTHELLVEAWERKAPAALRRELEARQHESG